MGFGVFFMARPSSSHRITDFQGVTAAFTVSSSIPMHFISQRGAN
jgi:hypothetical protein